MPSSAPDRGSSPLPPPPTPGSPARLRVLIPGLLRSYTGGAAQVDLRLEPPPAPLAADRDAAPPGRPPDRPAAADVATALAELDRRFPGLRFRLVDEQGGIRPHVKLFLDARQVRDLRTALPTAGELMIVGALSGG